MILKAATTLGIPIVLLYVVREFFIIAVPADVSGEMRGFAIFAAFAAWVIVSGMIVFVLNPPKR